MSTEVKPPEKSLSYMAWSMKEMAESIKKIATIMGEYLAEVRKNGQAPEGVVKAPTQDEIQF